MPPATPGREMDVGFQQQQPPRSRLSQTSGADYPAQPAQPYGAVTSVASLRIWQVADLAAVNDDCCCGQRSNRIETCGCCFDWHVALPSEACELMQSNQQAALFTQGPAIGHASTLHREAILSIVAALMVSYPQMHSHGSFQLLSGGPLVHPLLPSCQPANLQLRMCSFTLQRNHPGYGYQVLQNHKVSGGFILGPTAVRLMNMTGREAGGEKGWGRKTCLQLLQNWSMCASHHAFGSCWGADQWLVYG